VWVFARSGSTWEQLKKLTGEGEAGAGLFGAGAALSGSGQTALVGGPADNGEAGAAWAFTDTPLAPSVVTGEASAIGQSTATLNATVNPNGQTVTDCHFNWGTTAGYGSSAPCSTLPGSGNSPVPVSASLTGLTKNTTYHFQIVATNATGTSEGADRTFTTPSPPEFGTCVKLPTGQTGKFATAACTTAATPEKHAYEWLPGPGAKAKFTTKIKELTTATLETTTKQKVICTGQSGAGEYTGPKTVAGVTFTFTGCALSGAKCSSPEAGEGELVSSTLEGSLGVIKKSTEGPLKDKIGLDLAGVGEAAPVLHFTCGATTINVSGSVIVAVLINRMVSKATLSFTQGVGKQKPESFEGLPKDVLEATFGEAAPVQMGLKLVTVQTDEQALEVNSVV
jgi:hypothetical protein